MIRKYRQRLLLVILTFATILLFGIYLIENNIKEISEWFTDPGCLGDAPYSETIIEQMGNFTLPTSTQNLEASSVGFQDCFVYISFEMSPDDLEALLASSDVASVTPTRGDNMSVFYNWMGDSVNWQFDENKLYLLGYGGNDISENQAIVIDTSDSHYKVYIITALM